MINVSVIVVNKNANLLNRLNKTVRRIINHPFTVSPHPFLYTDFCRDCELMLDALRDIKFDFSDEDTEEFKIMFDDIIDISEFFYTKFSTLLLQIRTSSTTAQASTIATIFVKEAKKLEASIFYGETYCID